MNTTVGLLYYALSSKALEAVCVSGPASITMAGFVSTLLSSIMAFFKRLALGSFATIQDGIFYLTHGADPPMMRTTFAALKDTSISGDEVSMSKYQGKVTLLVNVASK